jgi:hypothetical protein
MKKSIGVLCLLVGLVGFVFAATSEATYCCEKTTSGAWCSNEAESMCDTGYRLTPTSCESTSYCKLGTCYDSVEGICLENVPQVVCAGDGGTWTEDGIKDIAACSLGCCIIGDQAAFVSLVRCKRLSSVYGIDIDYRTDIASESECIVEANSEDSGACVYEKDYERICQFTTRDKCSANNNVDVVNQTNITTSSEKTFYKDYLCSAEELNTVCSKQVETTCYDGDVYWMDSCGNRENIWSTNEGLSWNNGRTLRANKICNPNDGSDKNCGNCDYLLGTRCAEKTGTNGHYCRQNECVDNKGDVRENGESWCARDENSNSPGARYYRQICDDGGVRTEPCAEYRNEICVENVVDAGTNDFGMAGCVTNRWEDCVLQIDEDSCSDSDRRDCKWNAKVMGITLNNNSDDGFCVPAYAPGLKFWQDKTAVTHCGQASATCTVVVEKNLLGIKNIASGEECLRETWAKSANGVCNSLGDCGGSVNYANTYTDGGSKWIIKGAEQEFR